MLNRRRMRMPADEFFFQPCKASFSIHYFITVSIPNAYDPAIAIDGRFCQTIIAFSFVPGDLI